MRVARAVCAVTVFILVASRCGVQACCAVTDSEFEAGARTRSVLRRLHDDEHRVMRRYFPEGGLFSLSFAGFALAARAVRSNDDQLRAQARAELPFLLQQTMGERDVDPFSSWGNDPGRGVIWEGHRNLLRAAYVAVGGDDPQIVADFHVGSEHLARAFLAAPSANLESFPHQVWPVDNVVALESLRLHDVFFGTAHAAAIARWLARERRLLDATGLPVSEIDLDGERVRDGPRGCALSWTLAFLPALDPALAASLWSTYRSSWSVDVAGLRGFREWPPGRDGVTDADSGPVVSGIGAAASAFGVAAAAANGDDSFRVRMLLALDALTFPGPDVRGELALFGGHVLLADVLALWTSTWTRLDAPRTATFAPWSQAPGAAFLVVLFLLTPVFVVGALGVGPLRAARGATLEEGEQRVIAAVVTVAVIVVAADLSLPLGVLALVVVRRVSVAVVRIARHA